jgi:hypothetical protein
MNRKAYASVATYLISKGATKDFLRSAVAAEFNEISDGEKGEHAVRDAEHYVTAIYRVARATYRIPNNILIAKLAEHGVR